LMACLHAEHRDRHVVPDADRLPDATSQDQNWCLLPVSAIDGPSMSDAPVSYTKCCPRIAESSLTLLAQGPNTPLVEGSWPQSSIFRQVCRRLQREIS
jgi:hypothetical protein